jgi:hypothetical protein
MGLLENLKKKFDEMKSEVKAAYQEGYEQTAGKQKDGETKTENEQDKDN